MMKRLGGEKSPRKMTIRSAAGSKGSRPGHAASMAYRSIAGSLASKRPQARRTQPGSVKSLPAMVLPGPMVPEMKSNEESSGESPLPTTIAASSPGNFNKSLKNSSSKKRPKQVGENSRQCPGTIAIVPAAGTHLPAPRGRARDKNAMASSLGELVATGVLRADNAALLMTITPDLTLETVLGPQQILQLATTLRLYTKLETESKKTAASAIEKLILSMADGGCAAVVVQPNAVEPTSSESVPWDAMVEPWVCQPDNNVISDNEISEGHGGLPVIPEDDHGVVSLREEDSRPAGQSDGCSLKSADDSMDAIKVGSRTGAAHRGSREKRSQSRDQSKLGPRERGRLHIERRYGNEIGTLATRESRSVGAESRSQNRPSHTRRTAPKSVAQGSVATRESVRSIENRSTKSHVTNDHSRATENARSGSVGRASSRHRNQDFSGSVSIITGDSSRDSRERVRWGNLERNTRKEEPDPQESGRKGHGFLRMFGMGGSKNQEEESGAESDSDSDAESDSESSSSEPSEDSDEECDGEIREEIEHALTTEGSADVLERKQTLRTWMESRKKNKQPPLEKRVHHLLAAGREKKKDKKKVQEVGYDQGGILGAASEDLSSTGSLNTFTSIPSQVHVLGEDAETPAESSTTVTAPSPVPPLLDSAGNMSAPVDTDSLDQLRRLFHVEGLPEFLDDCVEVEVNQNPGVGKRREDLILIEQDPPSEQPTTTKTTIDPLQIYEPKHDEKQEEQAEPLKNSGKGSQALKRRDESMNLLMSFSKSGASLYGSGSNSSDASNDSNSTEDEGSLVEAIANELMETSSLRHILLASGMQRKMKKPSSLSLRKKMESTAIIKEGSHEDALARTFSDISRDAALQGCAPGIVGCHRPCPLPTNHALSPTAEQKSTLFFLELQHRRWQQQQQEKQQQQQKPQQDSRSTAAHGIYTIPAAAPTASSSCSVTTTDNSKKKKSKGASSIGFWNWITTG